MTTIDEHIAQRLREAHSSGELAQAKSYGKPLDFGNGYAPNQGDAFTFLTATGGVTGTFDSVTISGLMPGFEYELSYVGGQLVLEALNDGVPLRRVYLPLVAR